MLNYYQLEGITMYSRDTIHTDGNLDFMKDELKGIDTINHGIYFNTQEKIDHYDKGYKSIPCDQLIQIQTNKYQGNK